MRQQELHSTEAFELVEPPTLSVSDASARLQPAPAAPDMPRAAGLLIIASYAVLMGAFVVTIHGARADFAIAIGAFYLAMFFGVPAVFLGVEARRSAARIFANSSTAASKPRPDASAALVRSCRC